MDINSLKDTVSNLTLYDLKAGVRKVQNGVSFPWPPDVFSKLITDPSGNELHGDGGEGTVVLPVVLCAFSDRGCDPGSRGHEQRAMGCILNADAGNCKWNIQLVSNMTCRACMPIC
jgi:hypothetical protein